MSDLKTKLKCTVVMIKYDEIFAPRDEMIVAVDIETKKLNIAYLSDLSHLEKPVYFYLISDRKAELGDAAINIDDNKIFEVTQSNIDLVNNFKNFIYKKIEASTNPNLSQLPKIPPTFIGKYYRKIFDVTQVNINMELLLDNCDFTKNKNFPEYNYTIETRKDNTVILSKINPIFTYEDMINAYKFGRYSTDKASLFYGQNAEEFLKINYFFDIPKNLN